MSLLRLPIASAALAIMTAAHPAEAEYFGRNKVQYRDFDFHVLKTRNFDIYYYPEEKEASEHAARLAERWYARLSRILGHRFTRRQPLILYASHPHFEQTNVLSGLIGESTGGATEVLKRRMVMPFAGPLAETDHVLGHELVHAFQYDITGAGGPISSANIPSAVQMPLWFIEGMAEYLSVGPVDPHTSMWLRDAAKNDKLPTIRQLNDPRYFPYRYGQALWAFIAGRWGDEAVAEALKASIRRPDGEKVLEEVTGMDAKALSEEWHGAIRAAYRPLFESKQAAARYGRAVITERNAGELNVGPALSPDGERLIFLSEKDLFSIDLYMADMRTGEVRRRIVETAVDPHFDSLQFVNSAGGWDPAGRRFAFAGVRGGGPVVSIRDLEHGRTVKEIRFKELGEVHDPTWSPDGNVLAFSAIVGGFNDLFTYDLRTEKLRRLTQDAYADLQPAWSPDGRSIAFVTDRFSTNLDTLAAGNYRLAAIDPVSGDVRALPSFEEDKNIDPQWSPDGHSLFFLSDRNGITNVYRLDVASGQTSQLTDLLTGVSGITALSPSLSVARNRLVFSVYEESDHRIYSVEGDALAGQPLKEPEEKLQAATLPSGTRHASDVATYRDDSRFGLPNPRGFEVSEYKPKLSLDYIGQPYLAVGASSQRTFVGGGVSLLFSDILGYHTLGTVLQINGEFQDFGGIVAYENRKRRWIWGAGLEQFPYVSGRFSSGFARAGNQDVIVEEAELFRQTNRSASAFVAYPFSRASRVELTGAFRNISFGREIETHVFSARTGELLSRNKQDLDAPSSLTFGEASAALVYDTAVFGVASPILGRRYRFEASPTIGSVRFTGLLADFRQYLMPVRPWTLALRAVHYGRYGVDAADDRLIPLFVGYPNLVRGYDVGSFTAAECGPDPARCPVFDQLRGTKLLVGNAELRVPPIGAFGGRRLYGPLPLELIVFGDAGVAWNGDVDQDKPEFLGGDRKFVTSVGAGVRMNVFGYVILELDYVRPLDRPNKGWSFIFNLSPGF